MFDALEKRFKKDQKDSRTQEKSTDKPETEEGGGEGGEEEGGGGGEEGEVEGRGDDKEKKSDGASSSQTTDDSSKEQIAKPRVSISVSLRIHYTQSHTLHFPTLLELGMITCTCFLIIIFPHHQSVLLEERIDIHVHMSVYFQFRVLIFNLFSCNSECIHSKCELINTQ